MSYSVRSVYLYYTVSLNKARSQVLCIADL